MSPGSPGSSAVPVVFLYAGALGLVFAGLSLRTLLLRRRLRIPIGDASNPVMLRAMRVHANFAEYAPISLLLLFLVEKSGAPPASVHALGISILAGRLLHAYGVSQVREPYAFRVAGMALTLAPIITAATRLLVSYAAGI